MEPTTDMSIIKIEKHKKLNMTENETNLNITESDKYKKMSSTFTTEHKTEYNYTLVNQTINICKCNKGVTDLKTPNEEV